MKIIIVLSLISASLALRFTPKMQSKYFYDDLFKFSANDEYTLPKNFDDDYKKDAVHYQGDVMKAKILTQENKNHGQGKFKYSLQTQNGIELTQVGKLKDDKTFVVSGSYAYTGADGKRYRVRYTADEFGYHPMTELDVDIPEIQPPVKSSIQIKNTAILRAPVVDNSRSKGYTYEKPVNRSPFPGSPSSPDKLYLPVF